MTPQAEHKHLNGIHISDVVKLQSRSFDVHISLMKMWKKRDKSSMRADTTQITTYVTF
jgi:hypothetical protein